MTMQLLADLTPSLFFQICDAVSARSHGSLIVASVSESHMGEADNSRHATCRTQATCEASRDV